MRTTIDEESSNQHSAGDKALSSGWVESANGNLLRHD